MPYVPSNYTNIHRQFLILLLSRRVVPYEEAFWLFCKICSRIHEEEESNSSFNNPQTHDMEEVVMTINQVVKRLNMEIRTAHDEVTSKKHLLLINTVENHITRKMSKFSVGEMEFFKNVICEIVNSEDGSVSSTMCLNLHSPLQGNMTKCNIETLIEKFCKEKWLLKKDGQVYLSLRSLVELEPLLSTAYKDYISPCRLCKHIVLQGYRCDTCLILFHLHCVRLYIQGADRNVCCPVCGADQPDMVEAVQNLTHYDENEENMQTSNGNINPTTYQSSPSTSSQRMSDHSMPSSSYESLPSTSFQSSPSTSSQSVSSTSYQVKLSLDRNMPSSSSKQMSSTSYSGKGKGIGKRSKRS